MSDKAKLTLGIGVGLFFLVMIVYGLFKPSADEPEVTRDEYNAAVKKWRDADVKNYDIQLYLSGRGNQYSDVIVEVRNGRVERALYNGKVENKAMQDSWSVENQFRYILEDLDKAEDPNKGFAAQKNVRITLHAVFDPKYGYPDYYFRQAHGASPLHQKWKVQSFKVIDPQEAKDPKEAEAAK